MSTNIDQGKPNPAENGENEKKFTQAEVDAILGKRLAEERRKAEKDDDANAAVDVKLQELQQRELELTAREILADRKLPAELAKSLKYDSKETLITAIDNVSNAFKGNKAEFTPIDNGGLPKGTQTDDKKEKIKAAFGL